MTKRTKPRGRGRPKSDNPLGRQVAFRLTAAQTAAVERLAARRDQTVSQWIRGLVEREIKRRPSETAR